MSGCGQVSYINNIARMQLKDVPIFAGCKQSLLCLYHQYQCPKCGKTFKDEVPFAYPGTRITRRAASWVQMLLANRMSVRAIQKMTGIHWDTIHKVYKEMVDEVLEERQRRWKEEDYHPRFLAVDEFAIHKGTAMLPACSTLKPEKQSGLARVAPRPILQGSSRK